VDFEDGGRVKTRSLKSIPGCGTRQDTHTNFVSGFVAREVGGNFAQASTDLHKAANRILLTARTGNIILRVRLNREALELYGSI